jgi:hypothetical protein
MAETKVPAGAEAIVTLPSTAGAVSTPLLLCVPSRASLSPRGGTFKKNREAKIATAAAAKLC